MFLRTYFILTPYIVHGEFMKRAYVKLPSKRKQLVSKTQLSLEKLNELNKL